MKRLIVFKIIILTLAVQLITATRVFATPHEVATSPVQVRFETFNGGSESYVFAIIRRSSVVEASSSSNQELAHTLLNVANNWFFDQLLARYVHADAEELAAKLEPMRTKGIELTEGSSFIMVFKASDPKSPLGTLWSYYPDKNGQTDLQKDLDSSTWRYPVSTPKFGEYPLLKMERGSFSAIETRPLLQGGVVEMKRFALDPKSPRGLMLAMLLRGESYEHLNTQSIRLDGIGHSVPAEYALRCNHALLPIYSRLGFKRVAGEAQHEQNEDYIMKISREDYVKNAFARLSVARQNGWDIRFALPDEKRSKEIENSIRTQFSARTCRDAFTW